MRVLCVDPATGDRDTTSAKLSEAGFTVTDSVSLADATAALGATEFDAVVTEYDLPDGTGLELIADARESQPEATCVLYTAADFETIDTATFGDLVAEYLPKDAPGAATELVSYLEHSIESHTQVAYPLPDNEGDRVEATERFGAAGPGTKAALDRLTEISAALFDAETAVICLVTDRYERILSTSGGPEDPVDREDSLSTHAILEPGVTVIEDIGADPRFGEDETFYPSNEGFYAAAPILTADDHAVGVFYVYDSDPRTFTDRERRLLSLLAAEAADQLQLRMGETDE